MEGDTVEHRQSGMGPMGSKMLSHEDWVVAKSILCRHGVRPSKFFWYRAYCLKLASARGRWYGEQLIRAAEVALADSVSKGLDPKVLIDVRDGAFKIGGPKAE